jgi:hypothetical protein
MEGSISALSQDFSIGINLDSSSGSGTYADWTFAITGEQGTSGGMNVGEAGALAYYASTGTMASGATALSLIGDELRIGGNGVNVPSIYYSRNDYSDGRDAFTIAQHHEVVDSVNFGFYRTRGSATTSTVVQSGDDLGEIVFSGYDGVGRSFGAGITGQVEGTPVTGQIPTKLLFFTSNGTQQGARAELTAAGTWRVNRLASITSGTNLAVVSTLQPFADLTYDLGSSSLRWRTAYLNTLSIRNSISTGDIAGDNYSTFKQVENAPLANDGSGFYKVYGFLTEYEQATAITNEDSTMNQVIILGDSGSTSTATVFGVAVLDNSTGTYLLPTSGTETGWIQKLNLKSDGTLLLPTGGLTAAGHLVPTANLTYDLGSTSSQWRSLYVGTSTIYLGGTALSVADGKVTVDGSTISTLANNTFTVSLSSTGILTLPTGMSIGDINNNGRNFIDAGTQGIDLKSSDFAELWYHAADGAWQSNANLNQDVYLYVDSGGAHIQSVRPADGNESPTWNHTWNFANDGALQLPLGGTIAEGTSPTGVGKTITLKPDGGSSTQALLIYPTGGIQEGDHIHLTAGGGTTELYLGNDYHYVKLVDGGNVEVKATTANYSDTAAWTFGTDGSLTSDDEFIIKAPNGVPTSVANYSGGGGWNSPPYTNLATTSTGNGTGLTVNVSTAAGGYIDINAITINTPGTGYKTGDVIVITNENNLTGTFNVGVTGTNSWTFDRNGSLTLPIGVSIDEYNGSHFPRIVADTGKAFSVQGLGSTGSVALQWMETASTSSQIAQVGLNKFSGPAAVTLTAGTSTSEMKVWRFDETGILTFPDSTIQTTAYTGGGGSSIPTVVTTGAVGIDGAAHAKVQFTVASDTTVTAVGVTVIGVSVPANSRITLSGSPGTGSFDIVAVATYTTPGDTYIFTPFATNASGTGYGAPIAGEGTNPCLVRGTMITMADMSRVAVENITYNDDILVWDFDLGEFASAKPVWIKKTQTAVVSCLLTFSDDSELRIVGESPKAHRIFNKEAGKFTYGSMPETPIGTTTFNDQGEEITLISKEWIVGEVEFYNVMTDYHMNLFANSILTSMRYNNIYPITDMKFVKDSRTLRTADDYPNVEERLYKGFRLAEQTQSIEEIKTHIQWLLTLEVERETESV